DRPSRRGDAAAPGRRSHPDPIARPAPDRPVPPARVARIRRCDGLAEGGHRPGRRPPRGRRRGPLRRTAGKRAGRLFRRGDRGGRFPRRVRGPFADRGRARSDELRDVLESGDVDGLGEMLHEAYESKKRMNPHIAEGTRIERLFDAARRAGATGAKICGAGGGGYLLVYCPEERQPEVRAALERLGGTFASFAFTPTGVEAEVGD